MFRLIFSSLTLLSLHTLAAGFSSVAGNYSIVGCLGTSSIAGVAYCDYDELNISAEGTDRNITQFEFLKNGISSLNFNITSAASDENVLAIDQEQKMSLSSFEDGIMSRTSIEPLGNNELLKLSSQNSNGTSFRFSLVLKRK